MLPVWFTSDHIKNTFSKQSPKNDCFLIRMIHIHMMHLPFLHSITSYESASSGSVRERHWSAVGGASVPDRLSHHLRPYNPWWSTTRDQSPRKRYQHHHQRVGAGSGIQHQRVRSDRQYHQCPYEHLSLHLWVHFSPESSFIQITSVFWSDKALKCLRCFAYILNVTFSL